MKTRRNNRVARPKRPQQVRIISGQWKRTPLPVADIEGLRPTTDRVRETVFSWINHLWGGEWEMRHCLDLFAGTGALGFEAASRGASHVMLVESSTPVSRQLEAIKTKLKAEQVEVVRGDALRVAQGLAAAGQRFDLIFLDPPYKQDWLPKALSSCASLLAPGGLVYVESAHPLDVKEGEGDMAWLHDWGLIRTGRAGIVFYSLLERVN